MKVIIVGGGIGGLTTALMLHARGIKAEVYEQSSEIRELGVGINTLPQAIKELKLLGLLDQLDASGLRTRELIYANCLGQEIWREPRGIEAGYDVPQFSIHRGRLQGVVHKAVLERLGPTAVRTGCRLGSYQQDEGGVSAFFFDRDGRHVHTARGDVLIAADGIHSFVRASLYPQEGPPTWNGVMLWRGATEWPAFLTGQSMIIAGGMTAKLVVYPIAEGYRPGLKLTNWALAAKLSDGATPPPRREDWSRPGKRDDLDRHMSRFQIPHLNVPALVAGTDEFFEYPMCDRDPLPKWTFGRVTLLGDAAHPMYPVGSNGASQAILDARLLADLLVRADHPMAALRAYEAERLPKTTEIVRANRLGGPERVIDEVEEIAPNGFADIDAVLPHSEREAIVKGYLRKTTSYDTAKAA